MNAAYALELSLETAERAVLSARRAATAFGGLVVLLIGIEMLVFGALLLLGPGAEERVVVWLPMAASLITPALAAVFFYRRRLGQSAVLRLPFRADPSRFYLLVLFAIPLSFVLGAFGPPLDLAPNAPLSNYSVWTIAALFWSFGLVFLIRGFCCTRLWEVLALILAYGVSPYFCVKALTYAEDAAWWMGALALVAGALCTVAGGSLEHRWRRFVASLPKEAAA